MRVRIRRPDAGFVRNQGLGLVRCRRMQHCATPCNAISPCVSSRLAACGSRQEEDQNPTGSRRSEQAFVGGSGPIRFTRRPAADWGGAGSRRDRDGYPQRCQYGTAVLTSLNFRSIVITDHRHAIGINGFEMIDENDNLRTHRDPFQVNVSEIRKMSGLSQKDFSCKYGFELRALQEWEQDRRMPDKSSRILLSLIERMPDMVENILRSKEFSQEKPNSYEEPKMRTYFGMTQGSSYAFIDLPSDNAATMLKNIASLGWSIGGVHPLMKSPHIEPVSKNCIRVWGISWRK